MVRALTVAATACLVAACVSEEKAPAFDRAAFGDTHEITGFEALPEDVLGLWRSEGYGWIFDITPDGILHWHIVLLYCAFLAPMSLLRDTTHPVFEGAMHFGNLAVAVAVATVLYSGFAESGVHELPRAADPTGLGLGFGVNIFMFTAYMEVVSIEQDMADRSRFMPMIVTTLIAITALYLAFGLLVYSFYGEATGRL